MKRGGKYRPDGNEVVSKHFKIPVPLLELVVKEQLFNPFRLFIYLKVISTNGQIRITNQTIQRAAKDLKISPKTVHRHFKVLRKKNWIGQFKSGSYILRGFNKLRKMENAPGRTAVWFDPQTHLPVFKAFVISACLGQLVSRQRTNEWKERRLPENRRCISNVCNLPLPTHYPIACEAMAKIYDIAVGTAFNWKKEAQSAGFIEVQKILRPVTVDNKLEWQRVNPELANRLVYRGGKYFIQYPDKVCCLLKFTRRRSLQD